METSKKLNRINLKKKIVSEGLFRSELKDILSNRLSEEGFSGIKIRNRASKQEIVIYATQTQNILGEGGRLFNEISTLLRQRFGFSPENIEVFVDKVNNRALCAISQAESMRFKLAENVNARRAAISVMDFVMKNNAKGVEVAVSGKLRGQRAKTVKFKQGYMIKSGDARNYYVEEAVKHLHMKQGVLGIRVRIQKNYDPTGREGPSKRLPDEVIVVEPKPEPQIEGTVVSSHETEGSSQKIVILRVGEDPVPASVVGLVGDGHRVSNLREMARAAEMSADDTRRERRPANEEQIEIGQEAVGADQRQFRGESRGGFRGGFRRGERGSFRGGFRGERRGRGEDRGGLRGSMGRGSRGGRRDGPDRGDAQDRVVVPRRVQAPRDIDESGLIKKD